MLLPLLMPAPPGEVVAPVPGAIWPFTSPGEPWERVASAPEVPVEPVVLPGETVLPVVPLVPLEELGPPGDSPDCIVPGAACDLMSPGEPWDFVASAAP
jgi:hypothetical protein